ncbi:MAG: hypothetical protein GY896_10375 [Gammaproteobacteria bacterium]|nr:hypothetical protein [Gammaproteobacteria bacterium]
MSDDYDTIVVGGGLVGAALACGIAAKAGRVAVLDGADRDFRASRCSIPRRKPTDGEP